ncbi:MAG TPA: beta-eliminating lyase-related protein [Thermoanaerobaculia bacterium]|nr:beta-eliminating lyase-related protein [Thermoanaerobaculia bacterium]
MTIDFRSDHTHGASPEVVEAVSRAAAGRVTSYGEDPLTTRVRERCREIFETDLEIFPVVTGTAANALAVAAMTPPWGGVFCHEDAHIHRDELGAPEFYTGGAKLFPIAAADGRLRADDVRRAVHAIGEEGRTAVPSCVSVTQATEAGTVYPVDDLRAIKEASRLAMHMDGARFANALVSLGCTAAELTWKAGVDVLTFGGTKNGAMAAELIVVFRKELAAQVAPRWHRAGHRLSKMRFLSAQLDAYLADELWLRNARHANTMAQRLARGVDTLRPAEANVVFTRLDADTAKALRGQGFLFYDWPLFGEGAVRLVCGFGTTEAEVDAFLRALAAAPRPHSLASDAAR